MIQLQTIELFLHLRTEGVYISMALYNKVINNENVVWLRFHLIPDQTGVRERNHRGG